MAVGTGNISLSEVLNEVTGEATQSLQGAVDAADLAGLDGNYYTAPLDRLSDFKGYNDNPITLFLVNWGYQSSGGLGGSCSQPTVPRYSDSTNLLTSTVLYSNSTGTTLAPAGEYSDGSNWRTWNGSSWLASGICGIGGFP